MAAINANIVVDQTNVILNPTTNSIGVTVDPINLGVFTGGVSNVTPGGTSGQLQYNLANTTFGGVANTSVASNGTVTFQNLANLKVDGGTNGYFLQTDGTGVLTWNAGTTTPGSANPGGANTQIQYNDAGSFGGTAGFTFDEVTGNVAMPASLTVAANVTAGTFFGDGANLTGLDSTKIVNGTSNVDIATTNGSVSMAVNGTANIVVVSTSGVTLGSGIFTGDGGGISNIAAANLVGSVPLAVNVTGAAQSNITTIGTLTSLNVAGTTSIRETQEKITSGSQISNYDLLDQTVYYQTTNAASDITLNFRGNATTTANSVITNSNSMTATYLVTTGSTAYSITDVNIDGTAQTLRWAGNTVPATYQNTIMSYTFNLLKTADDTYTVLGSATRYG